MNNIVKKMSLLLIIFVFVLSACSSGDKKTDSSNDRNESGLEPVTIEFWADPRFQFVEGHEDETANFGDWEKIMAQKFMDEHPHVTINVQSLTWEDLGTRVPVAIAANEPPDILRDYLGRTAQYAHEGVLEDLNGHIPEEELDDYLETYIDMYTINGELHALPQYTWASAMPINRAIWEEKGKEHLLPDEGETTWSFDEFDEAVRAIKGDNVYPVGVQMGASQGDNGLLQWFWGHGAKLYENGDYSKTALNSPEAVKALERLKEYNDEGLLQPSAVSAIMGDLETYFFLGQLGAFPGKTDSLWTELSNAEKEGRTDGAHNLQQVKHPDVNGVESGLYVGPTGLAIFKQEDEHKKEWVIKFARYLNSVEYQEKFYTDAGQFPTRKSAESTDMPIQAQLTQQMLEEFGAEDVGITTPHFAEVREKLQPMVQSVILGDKTPEEALKDYEDEVNKILSGN